MNAMEEPFVKVNVAFFSLYGHLPQANPLHRTIYVSCSFVILMVAASAHVMRLVRKGCQMSILIDTVPQIAIVVVCVGYIPIGYANRHQNFRVMTMLVNIGQKQVTKTEEELARRYEIIAIKIVQFTTLVAVIGCSILLLSGIAPQCLDLLMPLNKTRPKILPFPAEFLLDEEKHFYVIYLIECSICFIIITIVCPIENLLVVIIIRVYGTLARIGYRMENAANTCDEQIDYEEDVMRSVKFCAQTHQAVLELLSAVNSIGRILIFLCIAATLSSFSVSLLAVMNPELINLKVLLFAGSQIGQFALINVMGEIIIHATSNLSEYTYNAKWYNCPVRLQRLFLFLHLQCRKVYKLDGAYVYILSLPNFSLVVRTAVSYCMVLRQFE